MDRSIAGSGRSWRQCSPPFSALVRRIRNGNAWDDVFVDALCFAAGQLHLRQRSNPRNGLQRGSRCMP